MPQGKTWSKEVNKLKYLLTSSVKCNKRLRYKFQSAKSVLNGVVDILFESNNCPDCEMDTKEGKHKKDCRVKAAILLLDEWAKERTNEFENDNISHFRQSPKGMEVCGRNDQPKSK